MSTPLSLASLFRIEAREYQNLTLTESDTATLSFVVIGICIGIVIASLITFYQRNIPGGFVRALLRAEALSPETAKTLAELGYGKSPLVKFELRHGTVMKKTVQQTEAGEGIDAAARYYIPEDLKYRAEARYQNKGNGPLQLVLTVVLSFGLAILLMKLIPVVLSMIDAIL